MGVDDLVGAIGREAARQREAILAEAGRQAAAIRREGEAEGERILAAAPGLGEAVARAEAARIVGSARLAARRELLAARQRVVDDSFRLLGERLRELADTPAWEPILGALLRECTAGLEDPIVVRCRPVDRPALERHAEALGLRAAFSDGDLPLGGLAAAGGPGGRIVCRNGIADRIEAARPLLLEEASRALFGGGGAEATA